MSAENRPTVQIQTPGEVVAALPHMIGFEPRESMVVAGIGGGPTARIDLPESEPDMEEALDMLVEAFQRNRSASMVPVVYSTDQDAGERAVARLASALSMRVDSPTEAGIWTDGTKWTTPSLGLEGPVTQSDRDRFAAEMTYLHGGGSSPAASREDRRVALLERDTSGVERLLREGIATKDTSTELAWLNEAMQQGAEGVTDEVAARAAKVIESPSVRDGVHLGLDFDNARARAAFWCEVTGRTPQESRATSAVVLGMSAYVAGDGAVAWMACAEMPPRHPVRDVLGAALTRGINPRTLWPVMREVFKAEPSTPPKAPGLDGPKLGNNSFPTPPPPEFPGSPNTPNL